MYKNPDYKDKYYYAYITDLKYINDKMTEIYIKTDVFQTWQFDFIYKECFVEREHVNDDTIGKHTIPEGLETGEYICNSHIKDSTMDSYSGDLCFIMACTSEPISRKCFRNSCTFTEYIMEYIRVLHIIVMMMKVLLI